jgi:putative intracellular protease/amidase
LEKLIIIRSILLIVVSLSLAVSVSYANSTAINSGGIAPLLPAYSSRFDRQKPIIAVVGENTFTELTDYVVPYGILSEANVADVFALATQDGALQMFPALRLQPQATVSKFDVQFPNGADYVIVPAVHHSDDPDLIKWILEQSNKGATIVGVCDGVRVLANAGLLHEHKAVGHWYSFDKLADEFPTTDWVKNTRYIADKKIVTTTGVTASIPVSIALIEAIAGTEKANDVAQGLGIDYWGTEHKSNKFKLNAKHIWVAASNWLSFWSKEKIAIPITDGVDEVTLALMADSYSRTYRSKALALSKTQSEVVSKHGLTILIDEGQDETSFSRVIELEDNIKAGDILDTTLKDIERLYGLGTAKFVALQLEYEAKL